MAQIASEDYVNKLIYLHIDTVTNGFNPALMQQEHRTLRRLNANDERKFDPMVTFVGNEATGGGNFTPWSTRLRAGVRIVPYDTGSGNQYSMDILNEILNIPDELADQGVFDRSSVDANVDIDRNYDKIKVVQVVSGSGVTEQDKTDIINGVWDDIDAQTIETMLEELHKLQGLKSGSPMTVTPTSRKVDDIDLAISGDGETETIVTRQ